MSSSGREGYFAVSTQVRREDPADKSGIAPVDAEMAERIKDIEKAARDWGVRPDHIEGKFLAAWLNAARTLSRLVVGAESEVKEIIGGAKELAELELEKLRKYNMAAAMTIRQAEVAKEAVIANVTKGLSDRLIKDMGPWLVLKQTGYNLRQAWHLAGIVSVCAVLIAAAGYEFRAWEDAPLMAGFERCAARPLTGTLSGEKVPLCLLSDLAPRPAGAAAAGLKEWAASLFR
jgi:hypothetical protein